MNDPRFVDPRLQEKEDEFERLHLNNFDIVGHVHNIMQSVMQYSHDIPDDHDDLVALQRSLDVTLAVCKFEPPMQKLVDCTTSVLARPNLANASKAQLIACSMQCINLWRILSDIPSDLQDNDTVTMSIREQYQQHQLAWSGLLNELSPTASQ